MTGVIPLPIPNPLDLIPGQGGEWKDAALSWYDPALGGTNSGSGEADPDSPTASGEPYDPNKDTCAAPPEFDFGTVVEFRLRGKTVRCKVNDRGGAIKGNRFDLSRGAAEKLGIIRSGRANAEYRVSSGGVGGMNPLGAVTGAVDAVTAPMQAWASFASLLMDRNTWFRAGKVVFGGLVLGIGAIGLLVVAFNAFQEEAPKAARKAEKVGGVAKVAKVVVTKKP